MGNIPVALMKLFSICHAFIMLLFCYVAHCYVALSILTRTIEILII